MKEMDIKMNWNEIFKDYIDIKTKEKIYSFCDDNESWLLELKHIFLHNTQSEMFILIDVVNEIEKILNFYEISNKNEKIEVDDYQLLLIKLINRWEKAVLNFINFELDIEEKRKYIKYNITLVIICNRRYMGKEMLTETNAVIKEERSTSVCRKIFLISEENILEEEVNYLPFYFTKIKNKNSQELLNLEDELNKLVTEAANYLNDISEGCENEVDDKN